MVCPTFSSSEFTTSRNFTRATTSRPQSRPLAESAPISYRPRPGSVPSDRQSTGHSSGIASRAYVARRARPQMTAYPRLLHYLPRRRLVEVLPQLREPSRYLPWIVVVPGLPHHQHSSSSPSSHDSGLDHIRWRPLPPYESRIPVSLRTVGTSPMRGGRLVPPSTHTRGGDHATSAQ